MLRTMTGNIKIITRQNKIRKKILRTSKKIKRIRNPTNNK
jgi:hypothetical protein